MRFILFGLWTLIFSNFSKLKWDAEGLRCQIVPDIQILSRILIYYLFFSQLNKATNEVITRYKKIKKVFVKLNF